MTDKTYAVGKSKPPLHSRFKPGQSGNPKGRPKGKRNLRSELLEELSGTITIKENGRPVTVSKAHAIMKAMMSKAAAGDARTAQYLIDMALKLDTPEENSTTEAAPDDEAILAAYRDRIMREAGHE